MKIISEMQDFLRITCPHCKASLIPDSKSLSLIYSGGPFRCGNCKGDVTEEIYGKPKKAK